MKWWVDEYIIQSLVPSPAEKRIIKALEKAGIKYFREVCFLKCDSEKGFPLRFDFYFPHKKLLLEYDGKGHSKKEVKINDEIKNRFAKRKGLTLIRLNKKNWRSLEKTVVRIVSKHTFRYKRNNKK